MAKIKWLDRRISCQGPYICLCLNEDEFKAAFKSLRINPPKDWLTGSGADATVHYIESKEPAAVVCLNATGVDDVVVFGLLVHEAVHVWQFWCDFYGERFPGAEQEAYAIQGISQELISEYMRRKSNG